MEKIEKWKKGLMPLAWERLSERFPWTEELLEKHRKQVDWTKVLQNVHVAWTVSMLEKFKEDIDWHQFSKRGRGEAFTSENLEKFQEYWDWSSLSRNCSIYWRFELLDRFADRWDWRGIVNNWSMAGLFSMEFWERYREHIPFSFLDGSYLWREIREEYAERLAGELTEEANMWRNE